MTPELSDLFRPHPLYPPAQAFLEKWAELKKGRTDQVVINTLFPLNSYALPLPGFLGWLDWHFQNTLSKNLSRFLQNQSRMQTQMQEVILVPLIKQKLLIRCFLIPLMSENFHTSEKRLQHCQTTLKKLQKSFPKDWILSSDAWKFDPALKGAQWTNN